MRTLSKYAMIVSLSAALMFAGGRPCHSQDAPGYAERPVIAEYDVDPNWPSRPDDVSAQGWVSGLAIDKDDQVWVCRKATNPVRVYRADGTFVRSFGGDDFVQPHHLRIDPDGNIWVADFGRHILQKFAPKGQLMMTLGVEGESGEDETHFNKPTDIAIAKDGDLFVTDGYGNRRIVHLDKNGRFIKAWGNYGSGPGQFILPHTIAVDSKDRLYVGDRNSGRIMLFNTNGELLDQWVGLIMPWAITITSRDEIWVCGSSPHWWKRNGAYPEFKDQLFMRFSTDGRVRQIWSIPLGNIGPDKDNPDTSKLKPGEAVGVHCIAPNSKGDLFVGDIYGERIQRFTAMTERAKK